MSKQLINKAIKVFKQTATDLGIEEQYIVANPSPLRQGEEAIYIDGDMVTEYWGNGFTGWNFQNKLIENMTQAGIFIEPYNTTIFDVYKEGK